MKYSSEILQTIFDYTSDDNGFTEEEQIKYTQELMDEFYFEVSLEEAKEIYNQSKQFGC